MSNIARFKNGHLYDLYKIGQNRNPLLEQIGAKLGGLTETDFTDFDLFAKRMYLLTELGMERNCRCWVDAEQTFIQDAIESLGQQMCHELNRGNKAWILNAFQCYMKRMAKVIPMEVKASQNYGFNLGIKLIRGAYMMEERAMAKEEGRESPVWDTIEDTHKCYNGNVTHIISNMKNEDKLAVGSHNLDSLKLAMDLVEEYDMKKSVRFGQLYGFSDHVTGEIAARGFHVFKAVPYGPTENVMPYLVRRGQESK